MRALWAGLAACGVLTFVAPARAEFKLLDPLVEMKVEPVQRFVAAQAFRVGSSIGGKKLSTVGLNFIQHFLGLVEEDVPAASLQAWALQYTTGDRTLIKALGGDQRVALPFLAYIHRLMEIGDPGPSHRDGRSNFAYVRSPSDQRLWAVHWTVNYAGEWNIGAVYVPHPDLDWAAGSRLFGTATDPPQIGADGSSASTREEMP